MSFLFGRKTFWFSWPNFRQTQNDRWLLCFSVDRKHLMCIQLETSIFKFVVWTGPSVSKRKNRNGSHLEVRFTALYWPFLLGQFAVPLQTTWYSQENCSFIHLKFIYSYTRNYLKIWKEQFSRVSSHGLKWGNKVPATHVKVSSAFCGACDQKKQRLCGREWHHPVWKSRPIFHSYLFLHNVFSTLSLFTYLVPRVSIPLD